MGIGVGRRLPHRSAPKKLFISRQQPIRGSLRRLEERARKAEVSARLVTVHPNPGPVGRDKSAEAKEVRRQRRYARRKDKLFGSRRCVTAKL